MTVACGNRKRNTPLIRMANDKPYKEFDTPVEVDFGGDKVAITSVEDAVKRLAHVDWPGERGPRHRDAYDTCLKALDGHRTAANARAEFVEAAREAGILAGG